MLLLCLDQISDLLHQWSVQQKQGRLTAASVNAVAGNHAHALLQQQSVKHLPHCTISQCSGKDAGHIAVHQPMEMFAGG